MVQQEKQRAMVNQMVAKLTDLCWDKCITGSLGSSISSSETTCLTNCAQRFMDLSMITVQRFKSMRPLVKGLSAMGHQTYKSSPGSLHQITQEADNLMDDR
ncbi:hypothetical protein MRB53_001635 [Persea americana]|uniref:Uncharacterized protein n=1 Tax=Persea americana TaxID=3435 RepID=A0ACC2MS62_PERAE|nr:hypothetical protein MRB53_001635 [Persea americana]